MKLNPALKIINVIKILQTFFNTFIIFYVQGDSSNLFIKSLVKMYLL